MLTPEEMNAMKEPRPTRWQSFRANLRLMGLLLLNLVLSPYRAIKSKIKAVADSTPAERRRAKERLVTLIVLIVIGSLCIFTPVACISAYRSTETTFDATVQKTERATYGSGDNQSHKYLVYTDVQTFECTDSLLYMKWNSSDIYGSLQPGKRYRFRVVGWRSGFGSMYKNIIEATPLN